MTPTEPRLDHDPDPLAQSDDLDDLLDDDGRIAGSPANGAADGAHA